jgi:hypothetical protein
MSTAAKNPLTRVVKRILDFLRVVAFISLIAWPLAVIVLAVSQHSNAETWGVDISFFSGFQVDLSEFAGGLAESAGVRDPALNGKAVINIDTSSLNALYIFTAMTEIAGIVGLYVLLQFRALFASLVNGFSFAPENSGRIRKIGLVVIAWSLIHPLLQYFGGQFILAEYALNVTAIQLHPAFELNGLGILTGFAMIVLSGVLNEAAAIHETQELTI